MNMTAVTHQFDDPSKLNVLIAFTGSVATIKSLELVQLLLPLYNIRVVCTGHSLHFIDVKHINTLLHVPIYTDIDEWKSNTSNQSDVPYQRGDTILHIELRKWSDILCIAPLSANTLAKLCSGICDNLLTCICRAWNIENPLIVAPAMNTLMYTHPLTSIQLNTLKSLNYIIIDPISKLLACGDNGIGAMADVHTIVHTIQQCAAKHTSKQNGSADRSILDLTSIHTTD